MNLRAGNVEDAGPIAALIASFQRELTIDPSGAGAEEFLATVSEAAERQYLESPRYFYIVAEEGNGGLAGFIAMRDNTHLCHLFVTRSLHRTGVARQLWRQAREEAVRRGNSGEFTVNSSLNAIPGWDEPERRQFRRCRAKVRWHARRLDRSSRCRR